MVLPAAGGVESDGLPPEECVQIMRGARIARMHEDAATELTKLQAAFKTCPEEIGPIYSLVDYYQRQPGQEENYRKYRSLLLQRLQDPEVDLPIGVIEYLIRNPDTKKSLFSSSASDATELRAILDRVSRQVEASAAPEPAMMRIQAQLQRQVAEYEAAAATLERLWRETAAEDAFGALIELYFKSERWQDAADLMAPRVAKGGRFRFSYAHVLGKLGRYDDAMKQVELLASGADGAVVRRDDFEVISLEFEGGYVIDISRQSGLYGLLMQIAWDLRDLGQDENAEHLFRQLLAESPDSSGLQAIVLNLYADEEERQGHAEALADTWRSETDPDTLFNEGTQRLTAGDAAGAIDLLRRAAPELPELEAAWYNLGMAAYRLEDWATVVSAFGRAGELNPARVQTFFFRGLALEKLDRCGEAVTDLERAAKLDPDRALTHYYLAACHRKLANQTAAAAALERYEATRD